MPNFNLMPNYVPPAETLDALPIQQPFTYTPPPPPSYIAPAPSLEEMYANMQPYMQTDVPDAIDYYKPAINASLDRFRHAVRGLPRDMDFYDQMPNIDLLAVQMDRRADDAMARRQRYWDTRNDAMWLPRLMGAY